MIESMEVKEMQLMQKLQNTIQLQNEKSHNYLRLTGQEPAIDKKQQSSSKGDKYKVTKVKPDLVTMRASR